MSKPVILTGLRANNDLHIGNYFGALLPLVDMAKTKSTEYEVNIFVPDLHSFTTPIDHSQLQHGIMNNLKVYAAAGLPLDNDSVFVYRQSFVPAHSELAWILSCFTGVGEMERMTQFKDKSSKALADEGKQLAVDIATGELPAVGRRSTNRISVGLFSYPVLMAADILLYGAHYVPVGDDQTQHLEFARDIAERMNNQFGDIFVVPEPVKKQHEFFGKDQGLRIRDLQDPTKKMSKSGDNDKGIIFLTDTPESARKKIMSATTDSDGKVAYDYAKQPGVSNLLDMLKLLGGNPDEFIGQEQYGPLKTAVGDKIAVFLTDFQTKLAAVNHDDLMRKLEGDELLMRDKADQILFKAQQAVGLRG